MKYTIYIPAVHGNETHAEEISQFVFFETREVTACYTRRGQIKKIRELHPDKIRETHGCSSQRFQTLPLQACKGTGSRDFFFSVFLVSGEINFNFCRSVSFLSKSEVKMLNTDLTAWYYRLLDFLGKKFVRCRIHHFGGRFEIICTNTSASKEGVW
jgi:hypothetical protein